MAACLLERGAEIEWKDWKRLATHLPAKIEGRPLLERGFKAEIAAAASKPRFERVSINNLAEAGGADLAASLAESGNLTQLIEGGDRFLRVLDEHPESAVEMLLDPPIRVGTIHSVKGAEADSVLWLTTSTKRASEACEMNQESFDEECRLSYVAATRARKRLIVASEPNQRYRMPTP